MTTDNVLEIDFETRSDVEIKDRGVYLYMASPHTIALLASYRLDGGPTRRWRHPDPCPSDIRAAVEAGCEIHAHNAGFERLLWQQVLTPRFGWPVVRVEQFRCTAAMAAAMGLPRSLEGMGAALGLPVQKDASGRALIRRFSIPRKPRKGEPPGLYFNEPHEFPEDFARFQAYCDVDVEAEAAGEQRMIPLSAYEQAVYTLSERVNDRGIRIDVVTVKAALRLAEAARLELNREMTQVTAGYVRACSEVGKLKAWLKTRGVDVDSVGRADLEDLLDSDDLPDDVRRALELRQEAAKTSVSKLESILERVSADGRIRGAFLYHAAGTGRWSSVGVQLHNFPRGRKMFADAHLDRKTLYEAIRTGEPAVLRSLYGDELGRPLHLLSDALRGVIWAAPGHRLLVADYTAIEGRVGAWFAGEDWKLDAFRAADAKTGPGIYELTAAGIYNVAVDGVDKAQRQVGKVAELALGYQGGVGAFYAMSRGYALKLDAVHDPVWSSADSERRDRAVWRYDQEVKRGAATTKQLSREAWLAAELVKVGWRAVHPAIQASWSALEDAARHAVANPGTVVQVLRAAYTVRRGFLWCRLPSGRCLAYGAPRLVDQVRVRLKATDTTETMSRTDAEALELKGEVTIEGSAVPRVTAYGVNSNTRKWERFALYGGLALENIVQAIARDLLANGMLRAEEAGYPVIGHVHDEIISEVPAARATPSDVKAFERLICTLPAWADGLPLPAAGWAGKRYRKD